MKAFALAILLAAGAARADNEISLSLGGGWAYELVGFNIAARSGHYEGYAGLGLLSALRGIARGAFIRGRTDAERRPASARRSSTEAPFAAACEDRRHSSSTRGSGCSQVQLNALWSNDRNHGAAGSSSSEPGGIRRRSVN